MSDLCNYMLSWIVSIYEAENPDLPLSHDVYDVAVGVIGIAVPLLLYIVCLICFILAMVAAFDIARGLHK